MHTGGAQVRRSPAHAGRLPRWERLAMTLVLTLIGVAMVAAVVSGSAQPPAGQHVTGRNAGVHQPAPGSGTAGGSAAIIGNPAILAPSPPSGSAASGSGPAGGSKGRSR